MQKRLRSNGKTLCQTANFSQEETKQPSRTAYGTESAEDHSNERASMSHINEASQSTLIQELEKNYQKQLAQRDLLNQSYKQMQENERILEDMSHPQHPNFLGDDDSTQRRRFQQNQASAGKRGQYPAPLHDNRHYRENNYMSPQGQAFLNIHQRDSSASNKLSYLENSNMAPRSANQSNFKTRQPGYGIGAHFHEGPSGAENF